MSPSTPTIYEFGEFRLDSVRRVLLRRDGEAIRLTSKGFETLLCLVQDQRKTLEKDELLRAVWPDTVVEENNLSQRISELRRALGEKQGQNRYIATVPGRGFKFVADVRRLSAENGGERADVAAASSTRPPDTTRVLVEAGRPVPDRATWTRRAAVACGVLAVLLAGILTWAWLGAETAASRMTVAVLPFTNLSDAPDREYLADGLAEETTAMLGQLDPEHLRVIARTSTTAYKRTTKSVAEIGRELRADYVVEGSIRAENGRFRVTAKLIRVRDQVQLWSDSYDREPRSMLGLQEELSAAIAGHIQLRLAPDRLDALARRQTRSVDAYDLYLRGLNFANQRTAATNRRAIEYFARATTVDPEYSLAWSALADTYAASPVNADAAPHDVWPRARDAATRAVALAPNLAEAQTSLGYVNFWFEWDWSIAEAAFRKAIELDPGYTIRVHAAPSRP